MSIKEVVIIQCELSHNRCSGFACTKSFYDKTGSFSTYGPEVRYISFT
ncbi:MAG: CGGC domain-containing protein, partial [Clostridia bacterium]|nr:CGGC domain-containing protein [Clostridia bacterium]